MPSFVVSCVKRRYFDVLVKADSIEALDDIVYADGFDPYDRPYVSTIRSQIEEVTVEGFRELLPYEPEAKP